ncbi:helix-turn-helix transcriptional regulator [Nonomuraea basaltis]|uniref:helix-turn-helix transcriptional regulator n=1 Tax=Nonomuraea basaltis TaxID=2495887 RepID=UPI00110C57D4|nr:helix-turn-helix transcriptional regulator [Nonomuraea basaltis]TMR88335.1 helix-turn-helix domain-containing protein [Nonomuraea basaltis]
MGDGGRKRARRAELAAFLRAQRARLRPSEVGLPDGGATGRRRTPGLRREEVAELSGVSVTWYTWLEQGRNISTSAQVIDALGRALSLDEDQHRHLRDLAGLAAPERGAPAGDARLRLQRLVDAAAPNIASVYDVHFDYLAWNKPYERIRHDPGRYPHERRNLLWMMFADAESRARLVRWEPAARAVLSQFRAVAGRHPGDPRFADITEALSEESAEFREWWTEYPVRSFRPATIGIDHPELGRLDLELFQFHPVERPDLLMVVQVPASHADLQRITSLLAATRDPSAGLGGPG